MSRDNDDKPRCTGKRADGRPCRAAPLDGTTRCWHHSFKVPGRPSKLTPEIRDTILDAILLGAYMEVAAQAAGVNKTTLYRWLRRGEEAEARALEHFDSDSTPSLDELYQHLDPGDWAYLDFRHALKSAEAFAELELLRMARAGGFGWQAQMTVMERRWSARWTRREGVELAGSLDVSQPRTIEPPADRRDRITNILVSSGAVERPNKPARPARKRPA